ncbi:hypothetical protein [Candidatus Mycoplasma haematohominis]|uniref:Uncharacterized protein n=1 Tax=Candidatus Mycoplasma haematohominis TaxID=1494318 RepID=A0A478FTA8_9MOLU|nr:hypothetical protein [Candidatus Mycoplasma haemohominis]GCE63626.1 hypothetical protein MHSWG343_06230 [Candidatus Mycoplasma haemohominis]
MSIPIKAALAGSTVFPAAISGTYYIVQDGVKVEVKKIKKPWEPTQELKDASSRLWNWDREANKDKCFFSFKHTEDNSCKGSQ